MFGNLGPTEIILIVIALLVLFGAKKLPEIGKSFGKGLREFKKATREISEPLKEDFLEEKNEITSTIETKEPVSSVKKEEKKS